MLWFSIEAAKKRDVKIVTRLGHEVKILTFDNGTYGALQPEFDTCITARVIVRDNQGCIVETVERQYTKNGKTCDRYDSNWDLFIDDGTVDNSGFEITTACDTQCHYRYWTLVMNDYSYIDRFCNGKRYKHFKTLDLLLQHVRMYHLENKVLAILPVETQKSIEDFVKEVETY